MLLDASRLNVLNSADLLKSKSKAKPSSSSTKKAESDSKTTATAKKASSNSSTQEGSSERTKSPKRPSKATDPNWDETKHPRASDGRFGTKAGEHNAKESGTKADKADAGTRKPANKPKGKAGAPKASENSATTQERAKVADEPKSAGKSGGAGKTSGTKSAGTAKGKGAGGGKPKPDKGASEGAGKPPVRKPRAAKPTSEAAKEQVAPKAAGTGGKGKSKKAVADVRTEGQKSNELAYDVGQEVWGSRKDLSAAREELNDKVKRGVSVRSTLAGLEKADPGAAKRFCTKENILQKYDWEAQQKAGVDLPIAVIKKMVYDRISPKPPADNPETRRQYAHAIEELHRILTPVKTMDELKDTVYALRDRMNLELPKHLNDQERYLRYAEKTLAEEPTEADLTKREAVGYDPKKGLIYKESKITKQEWKAEKQKRVDEIKAKIAQWEQNAKNPYHVLGEKLTNFFTDADSANRTIQTVKAKELKWEDYLDPSSKAAPKPKHNRKAEWERKVDDPWYRQGGRKGKVQKPEDAIKQFGLRGVQFGHWVDDSSGKFHLLKASEALQDLADTLGMDDKDVSLNGRLALAFGARGTGGKGAAVAHYEPDLRVINLTKEGGAGSLAYEWGHALDDILGDHSDIPEYASEAPENIKHPEIRKAFTELMEAVHKGDGSHSGSVQVLNQKKTFSSYYPSRRKAVQERGLTPEVVKQFTDELNTQHARERAVLEGTLERLRNMGYDTTKKEKELKGLATKYKKRMNEMHQELMYHHYRHTGEHVDAISIPTGDSEYVSRMKELDGERSKPYYSTGREMFARVFESWMQDRMKGKNHYLVTGTSEAAVKAGAPFPTGSERTLMFEKMDALMKAVVGTGEIKKALEADLLKGFDPSQPRGEDGCWASEGEAYQQRMTELVDYNRKLTAVANRFGSAEEFASFVNRPGFGGKSVADIADMIDNNSHNHLDIQGIKTTLQQGGDFYYLTMVDPKVLYVQDEGHLEGVRVEPFDQSRAKPIVVGDNNFIVDGRHRTVNAKKSGTSQIMAYIPAKAYWNLHVGGNRFMKAIIPDPTGNSPFPEDGTLMFRGIGQKELDFIRANGYVMSKGKGKGNDDDKEKQETCFSNLYRQAEGYARSNYDLYNESAAYVIVLPKPPMQVEEDEHGELIARGKVSAGLMTVIPVPKPV